MRELLALNLNSDENKNIYRNFLKEISSDIPFYKLELKSLDCSEHNELFCFIYLLDDQPKILMPMFLQKIWLNSSNTSFHDASSPYGYSGPLVAESLQEQYIQDFWDTLDTWYLENNVVTEFVRFSPGLNYMHYSGRLVPTLQGIRGKIYQNHEVQSKKFKPKVRRNHKKANQFELKFRLFHKNISDEEIDDFLCIYNHTMDRNEARKRYYFSKENLTHLVNKNSDSCALALVYSDDIPISTEFMLLHKDRIYTFLGGTISDFFYTRPNDFLKVEMITWARKKQYAYWYLGGGMQMNDSLYRFKKSFFPANKDVFWYTGRKIINHGVFKSIVENVGLEYSEDRIIRDQYFPIYRNPLIKSIIS
jgi:hypothetical protein